MQPLSAIPRRSGLSVDSPLAFQEGLIYLGMLQQQQQQQEQQQQPQQQQQHQQQQLLLDPSTAPDGSNQVGPLTASCPWGHPVTAPSKLEPKRFSACRPQCLHLIL